MDPGTVKGGVGITSTTSFALSRGTKLPAKTGVYVKHKPRVLRLPQITNSISPSVLVPPHTPMITKGGMVVESSW